MHWIVVVQSALRLFWFIVWECRLCENPRAVSCPVVASLCLLYHCLASCVLFFTEFNN